MDDNLFPFVIGIKFGLLTDQDIENASILEIQECPQINCSDLGLPNLTHECTTCGSKAIHSVEDVYSYILYSKHLI
ncbi:hypothetical protein S245_034671 [Arachis hypogaea]